MTTTDPLRAICNRKGVFLRREALELGYDEKTITRLVRTGALHRVRHGAYTLDDLWPEPAEEQHRLRARAVLRTAQDGTALSHVSALLEHGASLWDLPLGDVHTTRRQGNAGRREAGVRQHQGVLLPGDIQEVNGLPVTSPARAALELTTLADVEHSLAPINSMLHSKILTMDAFRDRVLAADRWPMTLHSRLLLHLADARIESVGESRVFFVCWSQGLPLPTPQVEVYDEYGQLVARVDFAWPEHKVFLEFDGRVKYTKFLRPGQEPSDVVIAEKSREERVCDITGWRCVRVVWSDLASPARLADRIARKLGENPKSAA